MQLNVFSLPCVSCACSGFGVCTVGGTNWMNSLWMFDTTSTQYNTGNWQWCAVALAPCAFGIRCCAVIAAFDG
jgi:hypothetical protein